MPSPQSARIESLATDGRGVVRLDGVVYFVPRALPGDLVLLNLNSASKPPSAEVVSLLEPSHVRVPHPCPHAALCQGSLWGSLGYAQQLAHKHELVERTLRKAVGDVIVLPTVASPLPWRYRNRISLSVWTRAGKLEVGYHSEARQDTGVPIHACYLPHESISQSLNTLAGSLSDFDATDAHIPRRLQIHITAAEAGLLLFLNERLTPELMSRWASRLQACAPGGIWYAEATAAGIVNFRQPILHTERALPMQSQWLGHTVDVHPAAFSQANSLAANLVGERLLKYRQQSNYSKVWDLYGGFGALGLAAAGPDHALTVFEISRLSEPSLQRLAQDLRVTHTRFVQGDLLRTLPSHISQVQETDLMILDPPRSGAHPEILSAINRSKARQLIYLSCNPARLGRDMALLSKGGFAPREIQPYDFFPQTPATEVLAIFHRV